MATLRTIARLSILAVLAVLWIGAAVQPKTASAQECPAKGSDVYAFARSTLSGCGVTTYPLVSRTRLSDGGMQYGYQGPDGLSTYRVPPPSFKASSATAAELALYHVPQRPAAGSAMSMAKWNKIVAKLHFNAAPAFVVGAPGVSACATCSTTWAGYLATSPGFTQSNGEWVEQGLSSSRCSTYAVFFWTGLGGYNGNGDLGQAGTYEGNALGGGFSNNRVWTEEYVNGNQNPIVVWNLWATTNQEVYTTVAWSSQDSTYNYFIENLYTGASISVSSPHIPSGGFNGATADFIVERPQVNNVPTNLANFTTMYYAEALANYGSHLINLSPLQQTMYSQPNGGGTVLANPSQPINPDGISFNVTQHSCN
jgi:hypothetical protein